jgi:RNA polymerase sigma-70 factor, ECF subfamily
MQERNGDSKSPDPQQDEEQDWVQHSLAGDRDAFSHIVRAHQARLRAFAARYVTSSDDVYDLVQDVFVDAFRNIDKFEIERDMGKWLRGICKNRVLNHIRKQSRRKLGLTALADALEQRLMHENDAGHERSIERLQSLRACIKKLGQKPRELVVKRYYREMAVADMAAEAGRTPGALSVQLMRIRTALRKCLTRSMQHPGSTLT